MIICPYCGDPQPLGDHCRSCGGRFEPLSRRASLNAMVERARTDRYFFEEQFDALTADADETIKTLFHVALVDGDLESQERIVIQHFADKLGMSSDRFEQLLQSAERHVRKE